MLKHLAQFEDELRDGIDSLIVEALRLIAGTAGARLIFSHHHRPPSI